MGFVFLVSIYGKCMLIELYKGVLMRNLKNPLHSKTNGRKIFLLILLSCLNAHERVVHPNLKTKLIDGLKGIIN